ncbi:MAG: hypothetical protein IAI49_16270, partial [Candidatus Eremiobacteraeota bacterium]|nr:hypothetical protein [Candidatus Eremiobacteraeota bacterium]
CVAFIVIRESRGLIAGESASRPIIDDVRSILASEPAIARIDSIVTLQIGPDSVLLILTLGFAPSGTGLGQCVERVRSRIANEVPSIKTVSISLASLASLRPASDVTPRPCARESRRNPIASKRSATALSP